MIHLFKRSSQVELIKLIITSLAVSVLSSCSSNYAFHSNVKADGAEQYFSASKVTIYNDEDEFNAPYEFVGLVEGEDCQAAEHLAPPSEVNARTQARQSAYSQKSNAVIFTTCVNIDSKFCVAEVVCYGKAYRLGKPFED